VDVGLSDVVMPVMGGAELAKRLAVRWPVLLSIADASNSLQYLSKVLARLSPILDRCSTGIGALNNRPSSSGFRMRAVNSLGICTTRVRQGWYMWSLIQLYLKYFEFATAVLSGDTRRDWGNDACRSGGLRYGSGTERCKFAFCRSRVDSMGCNGLLRDSPHSLNESF
jgi:hypothetical protein